MSSISLARCRLLLILTLLISFAFSQAQNAKISLAEQIPEYDLSKLWKDDFISVDSATGPIPFPEPIGFIGENYQRFYIHYTSINKNPQHPNEYLVEGKTKVKNYVCSFKGTIRVAEMYLFSEEEVPGLRQGEAISTIDFQEEATEAGAGFFRGRMVSNFYLDSQNNLYYDALQLGADKYQNNTCEAQWTSYKTGKSKICNWGDFGMPLPEGSDFDIGDGEVIINKKYLNNGWLSFSELRGFDEKKYNSAKKIEEERWWE